MNNAITQKKHTSILNHTIKNLIDCPAERAIYFPCQTIKKLDLVYLRKV